MATLKSEDEENLIDKKDEIATENSLKEEIDLEKTVMNVNEEKKKFKFSEIICIILIASIVILLELVFHFILINHLYLL